MHAVLIFTAIHLFQLIYDVKDGGASLDLITLHADRMSQTEKAKFSKMGVNVPSMMLDCFVMCNFL